MVLRFQELGLLVNKTTTRGMQSYEDAIHDRLNCCLDNKRNLVIKEIDVPIEVPVIQKWGMHGSS